MKIRKTKVTPKNIHMIYGLIKKFFNSIELGEEYQCRKWYKKDDYSYMFNKASFCLSDDGIIFEYPIRLSILINDVIHLDGNNFIIQKAIKQYDNSIYYYYHIYKRIKESDDKQC